MQAFINYIYQFVIDIYAAVAYSIGHISMNNTYFVANYNNFLDKSIISGDLITISMSWKDLFIFGFTWFLIIFFIVFFVRLVFKVIGLICLR